MSEKNCSVVVESVVESSGPVGVAVGGAVSTLGAWEQGGLAGLAGLRVYP